jgi:hypothetical protein
MADTYEILYGQQPVGTARMEKQGLYYCFFCRCHLPEEGMFRIHAVTDETREDLGICVPVDGVFGMDKKIPAKRLGKGKISFALLPKDAPPQEEEPQEELMEEPREEEMMFLPVAEEEPFEELDKLENAVLAEQEGQTGILIPAEVQEECEWEAAAPQ